jgi:hypothetical protein
MRSAAPTARDPDPDPERGTDPTPDIDGLARRLREPLLRLLRAEMRMERERSGRLRDARH